MDIPDLGGRGVGVGTALLIAAAVLGVPLLIRANRAIDAERQEAKQAAEALKIEGTRKVRKAQRAAAVRAAAPAGNGGNS